MRAVELFFFLLIAAAAPLSIAAVNIALGVLTLFFLAKWLARRWRPDWAASLLFVFWAWNLVAALLSPFRSQAFHGLRDFWPWAAYLAALGISAGTRDSLPSFRKFLGISAVLSLAPALAAFLYGTNFHLQRLASKGAPGTTPGAGFFSHHLTYAGVITLSGLFLLGAALYGPRAGRAAVWVFSLLCGAGLALSQARGYALAALAGLAVALRPKGWSRLAAAIAAAILAATLLLAIGPPALRARARSLLEAKDASKVERIYLWKSGLSMLADRPILGWGASTYPLASPPYRAPYAHEIHYPKSEGFRTVSHCHSLYLQTALDSGLVGLGLFLAFAAAAVTAAWRAPDAALRWGAVSSFAAFLVAGLFEFNGGDSEVASLAFFLLGLAGGSRQAAFQGGGNIPAGGSVS